MGRFARLLQDSPVQDTPPALLDWIDRNIENLSDNSHFHIGAFLADAIYILDLTVLFEHDVRAVVDPIPVEALQWLKAKIKDGNGGYLYVSL